MWSDYDPDGDPITFVGISATSSNGLALTTNATQILIPTNAAADGFSYTIADSHGATATGTATISIITNVTSRALSLDRAPDGTATVNFTGVPWYSYEAQRATNATFTGTMQTWPAQAWADGSIYIWDDFAELTTNRRRLFTGCVTTREPARTTKQQINTSFKTQVSRDLQRISRIAGGCNSQRARQRQRPRRLLTLP